MSEIDDETLFSSSEKLKRLREDVIELQKILKLKDEEIVLKNAEIIESKAIINLKDVEIIDSKAIINLKDAEIIESKAIISKTGEFLYQCSLEKLYNEGIPQFQLIKNTSETSSYTSTHDEANVVIKDLIINPLFNEDVKIRTKDDENNILPSFYLTKYRANEEQHFASEESIHFIINILLEDILRLANTKESLSLLPEKPISTSNHKMIPDIWLIKTISGRPIAVIEIKSPVNGNSPNKSVLNNPKVIGQLFNYMLKPISFHGQIDVIGISTDRDFLRVCWFPHSDEYMSKNIHSNPATIKFNNKNRILHGTSLISTQKNPGLIKLLINVIFKSAAAKIYSVPLLSINRQYIRFKKESEGTSWRWDYFNEEKLNDIVLTLRFPILSSNDFNTDSIGDSITVLRYYNGGNESNVFLGMYSNGIIFVVKQFLNHICAQNEKTFWKNINEIDCFNNKSCHNIECLIMPFVYTCIKDNNQQQSFNFDLNYWCFEEGAVYEKSDKIEIINENIKSVLTRNKKLNNCYYVAEQAITEMARKGYMHYDLHWRHVGLLPIYSNTVVNEIVDLKPILIDLTEVKQFNPNMISIENVILESCKKLDENFLHLKKEKEEEE